MVAHAAQMTLKELGDQEFKNGHWQQAIVKYSDALRQEPNSPSLFMNRGLARFNVGDSSGAMADFSTSLALNETAKAYHWLGRTALLQGDLSRAYYFFSKANAYSEVPKNNQVYLMDSEKKFKEELNKLEQIKSCKTDIGEFLSNYKNVSGYDDQFIANSFYTSEYAKFVNCLALHWKKQEFNPIAVMEIPEKIAQFMGVGKHVATVIVQTLPLHLSARFERVSVFDTAKPQIEFHNNLLISQRKNNSAQFIENAKMKLNEFLENQQVADDQLSTRIDYEFQTVFKFLKEFNLKDNIMTYHQDIFDGVDNDPTIDTVFLSSIPFLKLSGWQKVYYPKIRQWLHAKKTVVFSILGSGLYLKSIFHELCERFDDIAVMERVVFEQTPITIHVKFTPKK